MRRGHIDKIETYQDLLADPLFAQAFQWLKDNPNPVPQAEPYPIAGDDVRATVIEYTPEPPEAGRLETHHEHVDLQVCLGPFAERILVANTASLTMTEDVPEKDVSFWTTKKSWVPGGTFLKRSEWIVRGEFIIFDTEVDAHLPQRTNNFFVEDATRERPNHKVVIKLRKSKLDPSLKL